MSELFGNGLRAITSPSVTPPEGLSNNPDPSVAVVIQHFSGLAHLIVVIFHPGLSPENYIEKIREEYHNALCNIKRSSWSKLFTKSTIGIAQIDQV